MRGESNREKREKEGLIIIKMVDKVIGNHIYHIYNIFVYIFAYIVLMEFFHFHLEL